MNAQACAGLRVSLGSAAKHWPPGSKKVAEAPAIEDTLMPVQPEDVLEFDEMWSFVLKRKHKRWLWTVLCRRTRQIVAFVIGDRSQESCRKLWQQIPPAYRACQSFSDLWDAYQKVLPEETHHSVGKESGETNHMERWNCRLRQSNARYVRKTLSFSKSDRCHYIVTYLFSIRHNLKMSRAT